MLHELDVRPQARPACELVDALQEEGRHPPPAHAGSLGLAQRLLDRGVHSCALCWRGRVGHSEHEPVGEAQAERRVDDRGDLRPDV